MWRQFCITRFRLKTSLTYLFPNELKTNVVQVQQTEYQSRCCCCSRCFVIHSLRNKTIKLVSNNPRHKVKHLVSLPHRIIVLTNVFFCFLLRKQTFVQNRRKNNELFIFFGDYKIDTYKANQGKGTTKYRFEEKNLIPILIPKHWLATRI